ncbi:AAA family ATPase [Streptomyces sp. NPDC012769]|uniref:AAA family ATPase n=1 Tax=Streptomyces sp. NPDC012769 TaxID=3364848 RepID=UPI003677B5A4
MHLPLKNPETDEYSYNHFFKWPFEREQVIEHIDRYSGNFEVYCTPGMFTSQSSNVIDSHGSYVAWADFDGNVPSLEDMSEMGVPHPTLRVQSSLPGREHWYWRYNQFNTDVASIQGINKAIAYALQADIGAWDAGHSLRPVGSQNHKNSAPVVILSANSYSYAVEDFATVPVPQLSYDLEQFHREQIPNPVKTMLKHGPWPDDAQDLFTKYKMEKGLRSSALTRVAYTCCEQGLDNSEVYSMLQWIDKRWGKFRDRTDKERYYVDLINFARQKHPYQGIKDVTILADEIQTFNFMEVLEFTDNTEWIINGLLPKKGTGFLVGRSGTGKTTMGIGLAAALALGREYLEWKSSEEDQKYKILFLSLEMLVEHVNDFFRKLALNFSPDELKTLAENFHTYAQPEKIKLYQPTSVLMGKFLRKLENMKPDILLIDSASYSLASNLSNQEEVTKSMEVLDMIKDKYGCTVLFIHHTRKDPPGHGYREADLDDMFGSAFIAAAASTIISLKQHKDYSDSNRMMNVRYLKSRHSGDNSGFTAIMDGERRVFRRPAMGALPASTKAVPEQKKEAEKQSTVDTGKSFFSY